MPNVEQRYLEGSYLEKNPDWDRGDAAWKAGHVAAILSDHRITPASVCEVGCGSGDVLAHLRATLPDARMVGFDISPQVTRFWRQHQESGRNIEFQLGDFPTADARYDVLLMLDVFEHVRDPFTFLEKSRQFADRFVFHIPLDLSASSVGRARPLLAVRKKVGHLHYYTKDLALETLRDTGYEVVEWRYTDASLSSPDRSFITRLASWPRRLAYAVNKDLGVRLLGGETLLALARPA